MKKPNFFIVGAPKCGTTALSEYLRHHPNIFMTWPKEPNFLASDFPKKQKYMIETIDDYMNLFAEAGEEHMAVGEASVWYLYSSVAIRNIYELNQSAKLIVLLRNPVDLVHSLHAQMLYALTEEVTDFRQAWHLQFKRRQGRGLPEHEYVEPALLDYGRVGRLGEQVERLYSIFPRQQVKVILFDDFITSTQTVYEEVLSFLGVPSDGRQEFPQLNKSRRHKIVWLGRLVQHPSPTLITIAEKIEGAIGLDLRRISQTIRQFNRREVPRQPLSPELRAELKAYFREDIKKLSMLIDRDLSKWLLN